MEFGIVDNSQKIVTNGLICYLDAAQNRSYVSGSSTWYDISNNSNNATLTNGPTFNSSNGGIISFDGTNDHLVLTTSVLPSGNSLFTYSIWLNITNVTGMFGGAGAVRGAVLLSGNSGGTVEFIILTQTAADGPPYTLQFKMYGGGEVGSCIVNGITMPILTWHNVVLVRDGSSSNKIYLNNSLIGSGNISNSFTSGTAYIGGATANSTYSGYINGKISNVLSYNRALTSTEISKNYNAQKSRFGL